MGTRQPPGAEEILDKAIELAQLNSWETFALTELASNLDCNLNNIKECFRSKDDMADALFDRADRAMLTLADDSTFKTRSSNNKLIDLIMCWFLSLVSIKPIVKEIMAYKFEPGHFHLQAHGITRVSRTVQWFLTAAERRYTGLSRIADEITVTSVYLASFAFFLLDKSENHSNTQLFLKRLIRKVDKGHQLLISASRFRSSPKSSIND